jgi:Holliday junction resolvase RusA-like endonuclease
MIKFTIPGELTDLNTYINKERANKYAAAKIKEDNTNLVAHLARKIKPLENINLTIHWYCKNKKKDKDNISFAIKFILDGMVKAGVIKNDGWNDIEGFQHKFYIDKDYPRVEVEISDSTGN